MTKTIRLKKKIQIVIIAENKLLLLQFAKLYNGGFQNITGSVEKDETFLEAAHRELEEEIGNSATDLYDLNIDFYFHDQWENDIHEKVFLCQFEKTRTIKLSHEHQNFKWIPIEKVSIKDFVFPSNFKAFQKALEFIEK